MTLRPPVLRLATTVLAALLALPGCGDATPPPGTPPMSDAPSVTDTAAAMYDWVAQGTKPPSETITDSRLLDRRNVKHLAHEAGFE